jgi:hypothetical protein
MKISNIYVEPKFGINDKYVTDVAEYINKFIMEAIGATAFTEKDKDNIVSRFERELENCEPNIRDNLGLWVVPVEYSDLSEINGCESGVVEYNNGIIICNWFANDLNGVPRFLPPLGLLGLSETLTAEYVGVCDDIYDAVKDKNIIYDENKDFKALRKKKGQKFNIYANGELKVAIYTPDDWN